MISLRDSYRFLPFLRLGFGSNPQEILYDSLRFFTILYDSLLDFQYENVSLVLF